VKRLLAAVIPGIGLISEAAPRRDRRPAPATITIW